MTATSAGYTCGASVHHVKTMRTVLQALRISNILHEKIRQNKSLHQNMNTRKLGGDQTEIRVFNNDAGCLLKWQNNRGLDFGVGIFFVFFHNLQ